MGYRIFMSHGSEDVGIAAEIRNRATAIHVETYLYEHDVRPGDPVAAKVKQEIDRCDAVVVLLTLRSQDSAYVQQEIGYAEGKGKPVIPLVEPGVDHRNLAMLEGREYVILDLANFNLTVQRLLGLLAGRKERKEYDAGILTAIAVICALVIFGR